MDTPISISPPLSSPDPPPSGPPTLVETTSEVTTHTTGPPVHTWLHNNVRPLLVLLLGAGVVFMALVLRLELAQAALATSFVSFANHLFTEKTALKTPGKDT